MTAVLGLDTSLTSTGLAWAVDGEIVDAERIRTTGKKSDDLAARRSRVSGIAQRVAECVIYGEPDLVVIEAPSFGSQHGSAHDRSGLWWLIVDMLFEITDGDVAMVSPNGRAKYATGKGSADKQAVFEAVVQTYGQFDDVRDIEALGWRQGNDMADAVVLAAMGSRHLDDVVEDELADKHLEAMATVAWPLSPGWTEVATAA